MALAHRSRHIFGSAAYAARASELAALDDLAVAEAEIQWAIEYASPAVRVAVRRMSTRAPGQKDRLSVLLFYLTGTCAADAAGGCAIATWTTGVDEASVMPCALSAGTILNSRSLLA